MSENPEQIDLANWAIVHDSPILAWLGRVAEKDMKAARETTWPERSLLLDGMVLFEEAYALSTSLGMVAVPKGGIQMNVQSIVMGLHQSLLTTEAFPVTVLARAVTLVSSLHQGDQVTLLDKIVATRRQLAVYRAKQLGLVVPGGGRL